MDPIHAKVIRKGKVAENARCDHNLWYPVWLAPADSCPMKVLAYRNTIR